ncbi:o-succinylbenzoate--CoA ligase [Vibrio mexicanus]|uniref:o-succinylbenzoate--CoA ligase n=1 Tax=Vibrio mexicanus TaxID=1004326 RepID=UPI00069C8F59|nr:o-succinylbenzoate--CoA ligase [Vibrio mexicanus]
MSGQLSKRTENQNVPQWRYWQSVRPNQVALFTANKNYTWAQLAEKVAVASQNLESEGVTRNTCVTVIGKNSLESVILYLACQEIGAVCAFVMPAPLNIIENKLDTLYGEQLTRYVYLGHESGLNDNEISSINARVISPLMQIDSEEVSTYFDSETYSTVTAYQDSQLASIIFSSGSTGIPKAVAHTVSQHRSSAEGLLKDFHYRALDCWLLSLPIYHVSGLAIVHRWLEAGAALKVGVGNLAADFNGVTHASLVPTQLKRLLDSQCDLSLTHVLLGGSQIPMQLAQQAKDQGIDTWLGYGMTEAASTVTAKPVDGLEGCGHVLSNRKVKITKQRIFISGETLAQGYYHQGICTPMVDDEGWFDSKDLGCWQDGQLVVIGRADNQFISGGENIHCEEIERVLNQHPDVVQSIVIPIADEEFGHRPVAVIETKNEVKTRPNKQDIERFLDGKLEKFKWPVRYELMPDESRQGGIKVSRQFLADYLNRVR